ncbi:MAG: sarcosine oxidase subunit alpha family protein [Xanthobacteraceae bacterium]|nr:sarcosine oxidase subunit alpha family protein [Xanthobacteraceae bacterium]
MARLPSGGRIDRTQPVRFRFDGQLYQGFSGDTLASALLANGVRFVGRSFKYHRPRGVLSAGSEEPNALVELRTGTRREPNTRATTIELYDGLEALSQNRWPSLGFDILSMTAPLAPFMSAGFYYKTFMWPAPFWEKLYEPLIRRAAGLGRAAEGEDPDHYEKAYAFCDVLVIGGGPAGLAAALAAGRAGARVILCNEDFEFGGRVLSERHEIDGHPATVWLGDTLSELASLPHVQVMPRTTVFGVYDQGTYGAIERVSDHIAVPPLHQPRQRLWRIVAKRAVLAAGAIERPIVFGGNDKPGVMLASAVRTYINRFGVTPGQQAVVFTTGDDGWRTASDLATAGVDVAAVVDARPHVAPAVAEGLARTRLFLNGQVINTHGRHAVRAVDIVDAAGRVSTIPCDVIAMSNGWNPTLHLSTHLGSKPTWSEALQTFVPNDVPPTMSVAGAAAARFTLSEALEDGFALGSKAATECGFSVGSLRTLKTAPESVIGAPQWRRVQSRGKAFVDFQNDVTDGDIALAHREGFQSVEHLKRYTTLGMATDQGKTSNMPGHAMMAALLGRSIGETGTTVFRPPYTPVALGAFAGHHRGKEFRPTRLTPSHAWAEERGATFVETGLWLRAQYFPEADDPDWLTAVVREVEAVRSGVGVCDVSTLGKIDIQGKDAAEFLERIYINAWKGLAVGKARYGLMLRDDGFVMDDGTTSRIGEHHFIMTTTTAQAGRVMQHLEFCHQALWPSLDVQMVSVTEQWAQYSVAGPRSRDVLRSVVDAQHDISNEAFPYLAARAVTVGGGIPARLFRISFSGELAYELAVPAAYGDAAIRAVMAAGSAYDIRPYGTEALGVMRIEKGHVAGNELNGQTTARDLGLERMMSKKKDYIGRVMAGRPALLDPERPRVIGFRSVNSSDRLRAGAHLIPTGVPPTAEYDEGYMTSVAYSPTLKQWIGLGFLRRGPERIGERIRAVDPLRNGDTEVEVCSPVFVDAAEERLRV